MDNLHKHRLDKDGKRVSEETMREKDQMRGNIYDRAKREMDEK